MEGPAQFAANIIAGADAGGERNQRQPDGIVRLLGPQQQFAENFRCIPETVERVLRDSPRRIDHERDLDVLTTFAASGSTARAYSVASSSAKSFIPITFRTLVAMLAGPLAIIAVLPLAASIRIGVTDVVGSAFEWAGL